jgi:hypothetical protein
MSAARPAVSGAREQAFRFQQKGPHGRVPRSHHEREDGPRFKLAADAFPACDTCLEKVRFRLLRTAPYIFDDDDFED